ncbi:hypothetical protein [Vulcanisaeta souniana]|uniref:Uncharacterized protein n=1 Tax=Vulcanisaeta souniana JCM 11219 TaxID=1293586 RepID=A0A830E4V7_9CREN|nr:hypothetical protein [Vulcanisaeta souniana]BDR91663.1 hypothetical protein Vsou_07560 [Vulcanisaeta souniana JCM 11219]GGI71514.1 hypothetical protein GCM10007112_05380 [Vulcanisaeta souniana JCM 11219]
MSISLGNPGGVAQGLSNYPIPPPIQVNVDREFGNVLIVLSDRSPVKSEEGLALITVGIDEEGRLVYISIEPEDKDLARFISRVRVGPTV